jgi:hypothetical protein
VSQAAAKPGRKGQAVPKPKDSPKRPRKARAAKVTRSAVVAEEGA